MLADAAATVTVVASAGACHAPAPAAPAWVQADADVAITARTSTAGCINKPCAADGLQADAQHLGSAGAAAEDKAQVEAPKQRGSPARDAAEWGAPSNGPPTPRKSPEGLAERCGSADTSEGSAGGVVACAGDPSSASGSSDEGRAVAHITPTKRAKARGAAKAAAASPNPGGDGDAAAAAHATPTKRAKAGCAVQGAHVYV